MFGSTRFLFNSCNRGCTPILETTSVTVGTDNVVFTLSNRAFRFLNEHGLVLLKISQSIPTGTTATLPILFSSNGVTKPLTNVGGAAITVAQIPATGVYLAYYDKDANVLQLLTGQVPA